MVSCTENIATLSHQINSNYYYPWSFVTTHIWKQTRQTKSSECLSRPYNKKTRLPSNYQYTQEWTHPALFWIVEDCKIEHMHRLCTSHFLQTIELKWIWPCELGHSDPHWYKKNSFKMMMPTDTQRLNSLHSVFLADRFGSGFNLLQTHLHFRY